MTRTFGLADGLAFWWKAKQKSFGEIRASRWNTSFCLRPGTTDYDTYEHVFVLKEYDFPIPFEPKLIVDGGANIGMSATRATIHKSNHSKKGSGRNRVTCVFAIKWPMPMPSK
ncbi:MAG: hypothetical protein RIQ34_1246 [Bacteroidota bacterium]